MRQITTKMPPCIAQSLIKEDYLMKKRLLAIVLSIVLIVGLLPISAFAADTWTTKLHVSKNTSVTYNSKYAVEVGFGVQSDTLTLKNLQSIVFAVDLTVFDFIYYDADSSSAASYMEYFSENLSTDDLSTVVYQKYTSGTGLSKISWDAKPYVAKNGNTGYMVLQPTCTKNTSCTSEVILASILLGLKTSKDFTDITESSIRLATSEEANALSQVKVVMLTDGDANTQEYGKIDGGSDTLTVTPTVSWDGFTFAPTHAADTSRTESDATKHWNPCANHTDCGKRFNEDDHSWGSDGKCTVCSYLCSHASGYNYTYVNANNHSKTCKTCGKVENEPHTQKTAATCTAAATCSKCNHNYGPALGHDYTEKIQDDAHLKTSATKCTDNNVYYYDCSRCDSNAKNDTSASDKVYTGTVAGPHSFTKAVENDAHYVSGTGTTCQSAKEYYFECEYCNTISTTEKWTSTTKGPHNPAIAWTGDASGHWKACLNGCTEKLNFTDHHTPGAPATETTPQTCTDCGFVIQAPLGHIHKNHLTKINATSATCTSAGNNEYYKCSCGKYFTDNTAITETSVSEQTIAKLSHSLSHTGRKDATCTDAGNREYWQCADCRKYFSDDAGNNEITDVTIPALGHNLTYTPSVVATCEVEGHIEYWHCSKCNNYYADKDAKTELSADAVKPALNPTNHVRTEIKSIKAPTCTETGYTGDKWCLDCNKELEKGSSIPATGHTFTTKKYEDISTVNGITLSGLKCDVCGKFAYTDNSFDAEKAGVSAFKATLFSMTLHVNKETGTTPTPSATMFTFSIDMPGNELNPDGTSNRILKPFFTTTVNAFGDYTGAYSIEFSGPSTLDDAKSLLKSYVSDVTEEHYWIVKQTSSDVPNWDIDKTLYAVYFDCTGDDPVPVIKKLVEKQAAQEPATDAQYDLVDVSNGIEFTNIYKAVKQDDPPTPTPVIPEGPKHTNRRYPAKPAASTDTKKPDGVNSARTFDAGVALYVGMSVLSLTGTALVIGKKKEF